MMINDLKITLIQPDIVWRATKENLSRYTVLLDNLGEKPDLILFPEMFQTGFNTDPEGIAEKMDGETVRWMKRMAEKMQCAIAGSLIIRENRRYFNRMVFIDQYENLTWYDKRHLFNISGEEAKFTAGLNRLIVPLKGWQMCFQICYDLRFPVWARNRNDYDVLIYLANWPANRMEVWNTLLKARAIENQSFVVGVNRVGVDKNNIAYTGNSMVIDAKGNVAGGIQGSHEGILSVTLSWDLLEIYRREFPVWKDRDDFEIAN